MSLKKRSPSQKKSNPKPELHKNIFHTDMTLIRRHARLHKSENWDFRCRLKDSCLSAREIDSAVQAAYKKVSGLIDCTLCGNCCSCISPIFDTLDIGRIAKALGMSDDQFENKYLEIGKHEPGLIFKEKPCPFLKNKKCSVYEHRPADCDSFPHLHLDNFRFRITQAFTNYATCPIVFHVYEILKKKWYAKLLQTG